MGLMTVIQTFLLANLSVQRKHLYTLIRFWQICLTFWTKTTGHKKKIPININIFWYSGYFIIIESGSEIFFLMSVWSPSPVERLLPTNQPTHTHTPAFQSRAGRVAGGIVERGSGEGRHSTQC